MGNENIERIYTDEEIEQNPNLFRDEDGVHMILEGGTALIQPSKAWKIKHGVVVLAPVDPTQDEINMDLDYRLSLIELGLY